MKKAYILKNGNSIAVRSLGESRVNVSKKWDDLFEELEKAGELLKDFLVEREQPLFQKRELFGKL